MPKTFASKQEKRTYQSWADMRNRCNNAKHKRYASYGGRGIEVCERWDSFEAFVKDMGLKPDGMSLEREDNDGNYTPKNCVWADYRAQNKNKRTTTTYEYDGRSQTIEEWADEKGLPRTTLSERVHKYGWDIKTALETPLGHKDNIPTDPEKRKYTATLTQEDAERIRAVHARSGWSFARVGRHFGVSGTTVSSIVNRRTHV